MSFGVINWEFLNKLFRSVKGLGEAKVSCILCHGRLTGIILQLGSACQGFP